ncbi:heparinase II/III domain-containing protein [Flavobacterium tegetincola]|uniref:heparinase II/III domain-containing protein n=1 Tax=Flavobacterium tegetincola TaxID=150172 RepID=UPI00041BB547|nr:heparinase II/III family protein [Flavobacterium tegetincola]
MIVFKNIITTSAFVLCCLFGIQTKAQNHPNLILTKASVAEMRSQLGKVALFDKSLADAKTEVDAVILIGIIVPIPKDMAGGFTHEQHKKNYTILQKAGVLYQLTQDEKYAVYIKNMLFAYAKMYPTLPLHPQERSYARGKLFWQALNDANWLVYVSQSYDCVYDYLSKKDRIYLEKNLFKPFASFLSEGSPQFFNRIHNHSTWGNVAVGMIGLVMNDEKYVDYALNGLKIDNINPNAKDNDGGFIKVAGQKTGFLANLDDPFSPDGYYTEGPYYQRYAMYPFMTFAVALQNNRPDLEIFDHKNGVLIKAVYALLNLTNFNGEFFPLNDAQKGMSIYSKELVTAVDIAYYFGNKDTSLLSVAAKQGRVQLDDAGFAVAKAIQEKKQTPFIKKSLNLSDGSDGTQGGIGILRAQKGSDDFSLVLKYCSQGLSHGHYDKLSFSFYNNENEIYQDYGLARFVNIDQKNGGGYLKENNSWAKQTIAHNTITQDETSHFDNDFETGSKFASELIYFDSSNPKQQVICSKETNAYPDTELKRTMALLTLENFENPILIDLFSITSKSTHQYDLPYYYLGQMIDANFKYETPTVLEPLGTKFGYQHLWKVGHSTLEKNETTQLTWLSNSKFKTITAASKSGDEVIFAKIGANDPKFNLRNNPAIIFRRKNAKDTRFLTITETHGSYSPVTESAKNAFSSIKELKIIHEDENYVVVSILDKKDKSTLVFLTTSKAESTTKHNLTIDTKEYEWTGTLLIKTLE